MITHKELKLINNHYQFLKKAKISDLKQGKKINSTNYLIKNTDSKYVLKILPDKSDPIRIEKICKILQYCVQNNNHVLEPVLNRKKLYFTREINGYLTKYYDGKSYHGKKTELTNLSCSIAHLHKTLSKCHIVFNYKLNNQYYQILKNSELNVIKKSIQNKKTKTKFDKYVFTILDILRFQLNNFQIMSKRIKKTTLRKQLIHYDLQPSNVVFNNNANTIIDFDSMRKGYLIEEVAFSSFRFAIHRNDSITKIIDKLEFFLKEYLKNNPLSKQEKNCYFFFLRKNILEKISYILKKYYFLHDDSWSSDINKNIRYLKLVDKLESVLQSDFVAKIS